MKAVMYHYVRKASKRLPHFRHLEVDDFLAQLDYFSREFGFVSRDDFLECFEKDRPLPPGVVLTFDDAFSDHFDYVYPILASRSLWGIFYVATEIFESTQLLDVHRIHVLIGTYGGERVLQSLTKLVDDGMMSNEARDEFRRVTYQGMLHDECTLHVKRTLNYYIRYEFRKTVLDALIAELLEDEAAYCDKFYLSVEQIREMQSAEMIIGSHSVSHRVMSKLSATEQERELRQSFETLEKVTGGLQCRTFCYPYGGFHTFTAETEELLNRVDCKFSFNVEPRDIEEADIRNRPHALPRFDCSALPHGACRDVAAAE